MQVIYLDNNSTTVIDAGVAKAMFDCRSLGFVNPSSQHQHGQLARRRLEELRTDVLGMLGASNSGMQTDQLLFTSGGTESNNLALIGLAFDSDGSLPLRRRVLISAIEHPSLTGACQYLQRHGFETAKIPVNSNGVVEPKPLAEMLDDSVRLVSVMLVNNETGVIQPVKQIAAMCREMGVTCHTDAVQGVGKMHVDFADLGVDALSFTAHKLHGPRSIGGLILKHGVKPFPLFFGGFQQQSFRPGTEDVCLATGLHHAIEKYRVTKRNGNKTGLNLSEQHAANMLIGQLRDRLQSVICENCPHAVVIGEGASRVPHTLNVSFRGVDRQEFLMAADMNALAISTGSACASGSSELSPVLLAMGLDQEIIEGAIRISLSALTSESEIDLAAERIVMIANNLRR